MCVNVVDTEINVAVTESSLYATAATQTDEDIKAKDQLLNELVYQFLAHTVDMNRTAVIDDLATKNILSRSEVQKMKKQKKADARVKSLLAMLTEKSGEQFDGFLTTLSDDGQQTVAHVVRQALRTLRRTGQNPLRTEHGET